MCGRLEEFNVGLVGIDCDNSVITAQQLQAVLLSTACRLLLAPQANPSVLSITAGHVVQVEGVSEEDDEELL